VGKNETCGLKMEELFYPFKEFLKSSEEMNFMISSLNVIPHDFEELKIEVLLFSHFFEISHAQDFNNFYIPNGHVINSCFKALHAFEIDSSFGVHCDEIMYMKCHEAIMNMKVDES
jgi:hypothetical protein